MSIRKDWLYDLFHPLVAGFFEFGMSLIVKGRKHVPRAGGLLVVANHQSFFDPPLVGTAVRYRKLHYLARKTLFGFKPLDWLMTNLGAVPIDQEKLATEGIKVTLSLLKAGHAVLVFPEGARTPDGQIHSFKPGVLLLIRRAGVPILPVGIAGAFHSWPIHQKLPRLSPLFWPATGCGLATVIGPAIDPKTLAGRKPDEALAILRETITDLHQEAEAIRKK